MFTACIDPGHGGEDPGCSNDNGFQEKTFTLNLGTALRNELIKQRRCAATMTRESDCAVGLGERHKHATSSNADLVISIHANTHHDIREHGPLCFHLFGVAIDESEAIIKNLNRQGEYADYDIIRPMKVQSIIARPFDIDGSKHWTSRAFNVLYRYGQIPSVLLECGYITNKQDLEWMCSEDGQVSLINAMISCVDISMEKHNVKNRQ